MDWQAYHDNETYPPTVQPPDVGPARPGAFDARCNKASASRSKDQPSREFSATASTLLDAVYRSIAHDPEAARAAALRLADHLTSEAAGPTRACGGLASWQKRKVEQYLRAHLECPLRLETLAALVSLSVSHFCRAFKESFGTTPHAYIIRLRLELARQLMLTTQDPLSQIALACGMADQAHLSKLFRGEMGESPSAWRRRTLTEAKAGMNRRASPEDRLQL